MATVVFEIAYDLLIALYGLSLRVAAFFHPKAKAWVKGRHRWPDQLQQGLSKRQPEQPLVWFHCASLGEFEQGRPLIEWIKLEYPEVFVVLTFFSPSGYQVRRNYPQADWVGYLPLDTPRNARRWVEILRPQLVVLVKYEFWYRLLQRLSNTNTPTWAIAALLRPGQIFFQPYARAYLNVVRQMDWIFVQDESSLTLLRTQGWHDRILAVGDPRIDRVLSIAGAAPDFPPIAAFCGEAPILIAGSTWPKDEALLAQALPLLPAEWKIILAPHEVGEQHLLAIERQFPFATIRYSAWQQHPVSSSRILLIDNIGMLASLYRYGDLAYIGGGFGVSIHNILEPAAFALPLIFGPKYRKFREAVVMVQQGGAVAVEDGAALNQALSALLDPAERQRRGANNRTYLESNRGATAAIARRLSQSYGDDWKPVGC